MALLWCDGFDHYGGDVEKMSDGSWASVSTGTSEFSISSAIKRTGAYSLFRSVEWWDNVTARRVFGGNKTTVGVGCALYVPALPPVSDRAPIIELKDLNNIVSISLVLQTTGDLALYRGDGISGTLLAVTSTPAIVAQSFQHIEIQATSDSTAGAVEVRVNGVTVLSVSGVNTIALTNESWTAFVTTAAAVQGFAQVGFTGRREPRQSNLGLFTLYYDDVFAYDTTGDFNNSWMGDLRVYTLFPNADTAQADWTPLSGSGFSNIDDPSDDDSSYISAGVPGSPAETTSEFGLDDLPETTGLVYGVVLSSRVKKLEAGIADFQSGIVSNSVENQGPVHPLTPTYLYYDDVYEYDPDTGASFTTDAIDALQVQVNRIS